MITKPYVSVIIPIYNEEQSIGCCIASLRQQSFRFLEIIAVDDGSTDNSVNVCKRERIEVYLQEHRGPGAARNLGSRHSTGNILVFIDADMTFAPDYIEKLVSPIIKGEAIATCHWNERVANWDNPWARCQTWYLGLPDGMRQPSIAPQHEYVYRSVRKDFFEESGGYSEIEGRGDDSTIAFRTGVLARIVPDAICFHQNDKNMKEVFADAVWKGRNLAVKKNKKFQIYASAILIYKNPLLQIFKGFSLAVSKKEPRMIVYSFLHSIGFILGALQAYSTGYYLK